MSAFATRLVAWQQAHGRHDLPWQGTRDPYAIWVSEIMLQQTQVATVIPYYQRFMASFPSAAALAAAPEDAVLAHWSGLGYYSRARNLHRAARVVAAERGGVFPRDFEGLLALPGVGRSTAAAVSVFAAGERRAILDGNVKRVLARWRGIPGWPGEKAVESRLWAEAEALLPEREVEAYTQGLMDLGATLCTRARPRCGECPVGEDCFARETGRFGEFPGARPRKALPEKAADFLVVCCNGAVLLEKRPPTGIWGGLWSLPELAPMAAPETLGVMVKSCRALEPFTHTFSHFRLHVTPWLLEVTAAGRRAESPGRLWVALEDAGRAALPAPVKRLLGALVTNRYETITP